MQGKVSAHFRHFPARGITPACAGKSPSSFVLLLPVRDHPRVCGEKGNGATISQKCVGITPACAGKSLPAVLKCPPMRDHPRVCGEKFRFILLSLLSSGSPPRVRGKAGGCRTAAASSGITPAYAGKSLLNTDNTTAARDHPRACGEKPPSCPEMSTNEGSPPRMRGKAQGQVMAGFAFGITPAYAGKRLKRSHSIGHFSCILCLFHSVLHRASVSGGSRAGPRAPPCLPAQNTVPV